MAIIVALLALAGVTAVLVSFGITRTGNAVATQPTLLIVGDSYAEGIGDPSFRPYPGILAEEMDWNLALDAQGGTGFVAYRNTPGIATVPFIDRLEQDKNSFKPDFVIIDGGRNDLDKPLDIVITAMDHYLTEARNAWPSATMIIVVPSYITDVPAPNYPAIREAIDRIAERINAYVIDPVAEGWYQPMNPDLLWQDKVHPGALGSQYIADRIAQDLRKFGLGAPAA